ncbi:hypothetical protein B5F76_12165 [Desulfovibrio sp. An276]|uniref:hypothetical protein n=1 Tax=Desulfovibrio sp. An276 TaxID=1965618 RepID=UPI000B394167|nr:hypothetical protein [Desulfovibrio sp. An276]OUO50249.1 hypothetical protein B5F76_12165 [Desulfovibrio sp. An276]
MPADLQKGLHYPVKKLGIFEEGNYPENLEKITPEPVSSVNFDAWKEYRRAFTESLEKVETAGGSIELAQMKDRHRQERKKALSRLAKYGLPVLNIARHCLMAQQRAERFSLRSGRKRTRGSKPRFENWLRARGMQKEATAGGIGHLWKKKDTPRRLCNNWKRERISCANLRISGSMRTRSMLIVTV